ncbi:probable G-protein coupled receptor 25 [Silurus meridionalis]|uniref:G-protein coupled receptors family 1 profile domain-containing protein n=1 Tax=Silurus meridionalis TaxID=175797 RepID=A0A8T0BKS4_SILME|nr:probable G-protein coupled receptor 25 [Silurus meridionalis]KAF7706066.1 hypothetical protein HF521_019320 [Silurus meridionalis]KAI5103974.1 putative G-protein coupled receptor 25 [Silurus meridionalis]
MGHVLDYLYSYYDYEFNDTVIPTSVTAMKEQPFSPFHIYLPTFYFIMFFAGFTGNLFVIIVIGNRHKKNARLVDTFVLNLAVADLVFVFTLPLWAISAWQHDKWPFGELLCKISSYVIAVNRFSNIFFLTCMSVDRYLAIVRLMDSNFLRSSKCIHLTCGAVWGVSLFLGTPSLVYRKLNAENGSCIDYMDSSFFQGMILLTVFLTFVLPVFIILLSYGSIVVRLQHHCVTAGNSHAEARCRHSLKIVFTIIIVFLVSWLPYNVLRTTQVICKIRNDKLDDDTYTYLAQGLIISSCMAFLNSCLNPAIYLFLDKHFRHSASALFKFCMGKDIQSSYMSSNSTASNGISDNLGSAAIRGLQKK